MRQGTGQTRWGGRVLDDGAQVTSATIMNEVLLPQVHSNNDVAEVTFEQWLELLARYAVQAGGKEARAQLKRQGAWAVLGQYLMTSLFPAVSKFIPGKLDYAHL